MSASLPPGKPNASGRNSILGLVVVGIVFVAGMIGVSVWVVKSFVSPKQEVIVLPPAASAPGATAKPANSPPRNLPTFTGKVVDATTHQPVRDFTIQIGYLAGNNQRPRYDSQATEDFKSDTGVYKATSQVSGPTIWYVRVVAHGYLPAVSNVLGRSGAADFELKPGRDVAGHVFAADGSPAAGVSLVIVRGGEYVYIDNGRFRASQAGTNKLVVTGADGAYDLPPEIGNYAMVAISDSGSAQLDQDEIAKTSDLHLLAWGKIEGTLNIGSKAAANAMVAAYTIDPNGANDPKQPRIKWEQSGSTDDGGHFVIDRVRPGQIQIGREVTQAFGPNYSSECLSQTSQIEVAAGQTAAISVGGGGRKVTGKLALPPGVGGPQYYFDFSVSGGVPAAVIDPMPDRVKEGSSAARETWLGVFSATSAGREYFKSHPRPPTNVPPEYAIEFLDNSHKTFQIQDVQAGDYNGWLYLNSTKGNGSSMQAQFTFAMPPITPDLVDQPLEIPEIEVQ